MGTDRQKLGEILEQLELITEKQLEDALAFQVGDGRKIGDILISLGLVVREECTLALAIQNGADILKIRDIDPGSLPQ